MLNKILLLSGIFTYTGATSQITESFDLNVSKFHLKDFGFQGKVKTVSTTFLKKNETGEFEPSAWKTIQLHHQFDEQGNLISEYGINHDLDTCEITYYIYNEKKLVAGVKKYSTGYWGEYSTRDLRNWDLKEANFEYDESGNRVKETKTEHSIRRVTLNEYNAEKQIVKSTRLDNTSETNSTLDKTENFYDPTTGKLMKTIISKQDNGYESGEITYQYKNNDIVSQIFTRMDGSEGSVSTFSHGVNEYLQGKDTLTEGYIYTKSVINDNGELIHNYFHSTNDGEFKSNRTYSYQYDSHRNLTEINSKLTHLIMHSKVSALEEYYRTIHSFTYY